MDSPPERREVGASGVLACRESGRPRPRSEAHWLAVGLATGQGIARPECRPGRRRTQPYVRICISGRDSKT
jgi:hypothetical protein